MIMLDFACFPLDRHTIRLGEDVLDCLLDYHFISTPVQSLNGD